MERRRPFARLRAPGVRLGLVAGLVLGALPAAAANLPDWILVGDMAILFDPGFHDAQGQYDLPLGEATPRVDMRYTPAGTLLMNGFVDGPSGPVLFQFQGTQTVDAEGVEHIALYDRLKKPKWRFDGTMAADGGDITGTFTRAAGFAGLPDAASGPLTIARFNPAKGDGEFELRMKVTTDTKGRVTGSLATGGESVATVFAHGNKILSDGRNRGKVKTNAAAVTTGKIKITGKTWTMKLAGPLDAGGFHALADFRGGGFSVNDAPLLVPAVAGPEDPVGGGPPPKNPNGNADVNDILGTVEVHASVVVAGAKRNVTVQFPDSTTSGTLHADPASSVAPTPRRFFTTIGGKTYGTATAPADVAIEIVRFSRIGGQIIELHCTGTIVAEGGKSKPVNVQILAVVQ